MQGSKEFKESFQRIKYTQVWTSLIPSYHYDRGAEVTLDLSRSSEKSVNGFEHLLLVMSPEEADRLADGLKAEAERARQLIGK